MNAIIAGISHAKPTLERGMIPKILFIKATSHLLMYSLYLSYLLLM